MKTIHFFISLFFGLLYLNNVNAQSSPILLKDIFPGETSGALSFGAYSPIEYNNELYFPASNSTYSNVFPYQDHNLWKTNGTEEGTVKVINLNSDADDGLANVHVFNAGLTTWGNSTFADRIFFGATDGTTQSFGDEVLFYDNQLAVSDGTANGTKLFQHLVPEYNPFNVVDYNPYDFVDLGDQLLFKATCYCSDDPTFRLWVLNEDADSAEVLGESYVYYIWGSSFTAPFLINDNFIVLSNPLYVWEPGDNGEDTTSLVVFDKNTNQLNNLKDYVDVGGPISDSLFVFLGRNNNYYDSLRIFLSDGIAEHTQSIYAFPPNSNFPGNSYGTFLSQKFDDEYFFFVTHPGIPNQAELWKTDGTSNGTFSIKTFDYSNKIILLNESFIFNNELYFLIYNWDESEKSLWKTDGTSEGTELLHTFNINGIGEVTLEGAQVFDNKIFFVGEDVNHGAEIWTTNGTIEGTEMYYDLYPGQQPSLRGGFKVYQDKLLFAAEHPNYGVELYYINSATVNSENNSEELEFNIYPNPFKEKIYLRESMLENTTFSIFDMIGQTTYVGVINKGENQINLTELNKGTYILQFNDSNKKIKIVKN